MRTRSLLVLSLVAASSCGGSGGGGLQSVPGTPSAYSFVDVWAFAPDDVWFVDGGPNLHHFDGSTFTTVPTPAGGVGCIFALSTTEMWLCAGDEAIRYDRTTFTRIDVVGGTGLSGLTDIWASSSTDVFMVGDDAIVARYDGANLTWSVTGSPFKTSIWGSGPNDVYALDTFDLVHFNGTTWSDVPLGTLSGSGQIWGTGADDVWLMNGSSSIGHFDGMSWSEVDVGNFVGDLTAVWGPSPDDLYAVGSAGAVAHYDGVRWRQISHQQIGAPYLRQFVAVHGSSAADVWIVGQQLGTGGSTGLLYHLTP